MMTFWIAFLRAVGTVLFLFGVVGGAARMLAYSSLFRFWDELYLYTLPVIESLALMAVCFGAASALSAQRRMEARIARATASRRRTMPTPQQPRGEDLAPDAPNWPEMKLGIHPAEQERQLARSRRMGTDDLGGLYENVVAHGVRVGVPTVREAPPPVRITPGTENQYIDTPPLARPAAPYRRSRMVPHKGGVDRELLRQGRDKQIREKQQELDRTRDNRT